MEGTEGQLAEFFAATATLLDEGRRRMTAGAVARMLGRGGTAAVARVAHMSRNTVLTEAREIEAGEAMDSGRIRREDGGRKRSIEKDPNLLLELDDLAFPEARAIPCPRCAGPPSRPTSWPTRCGPRDSTSDRPPCESCPTRWAIASRHVQAERGRPARGPRRPVPPHQRHGCRLPGRQPAGHQCRCEEGGTDRRILRRWQGVSAQGHVRAH